MESVDTTITNLRQHAPFDQMELAHLEFMAKRLNPAFFAKGEVVLGPQNGRADTLFIVKQGRVQGESDSGADNRVHWELVGGELFPLGALLAQRSVHMTYRAAEDTLCLLLSARDFKQLRQMSAVFDDFCSRRMANLLDQAMESVRAESAQQESEGYSLGAPLSQLDLSSPVTVPPETPLRDALTTMHERGIGSIMVTDSSHMPVGVLTLHDLLDRIILPQRGLDTPISDVMSGDLITITPKQPAYEAATLMARHGIGHLAVVNSSGHLMAVVSERDLFSLQRVGVVALSQRIRRAPNEQALAALSPEVSQLVGQMMAQGAEVDQMTHLITELNDQITQRAITLVLEQQTKPVPKFTWVSFGSEGREEQTLKTDQDNGIIFEASSSGDADKIRQQLIPIARSINELLDACGFPLCKGNIMASNPECCLSRQEWEARFQLWIDSTTPANLLNAVIYFDLRTIYGDESRVDRLKKYLLERTAPNSLFRHHLAALAMNHRPPLGLIRDFVLSSNSSEHPHSIDLKGQGITPFVDGARIGALAHRVSESSTRGRLMGLVDTGALNKADAVSFCQAFHFIQLLRMRNHRQQEMAGEELSNYLDPDTLSELDRRILKEAFRQARKLQSQIKLEYQL